MTTPAVTVPLATNAEPRRARRRRPPRREELDEREVEGDEALRVEAGVEVLAVHVAEAADVAVLAHVGLRDPHARQALLQVGVDGGDAVARPLVGRAERRLNQMVATNSGGSTDAATSASCGDSDEDHGHADAREEADDGVDEAGLQQLRQGLDVGGHAGHDPARPSPGRSSRATRRCRWAKIRTRSANSRRSAVRPGDERVAPRDAPVEQDDDGEDGRDHPQGVRRVPGDAVVDAEAHEERARRA